MGTAIIVQGTWLKIAMLKDEDYQEHAVLASIHGLDAQVQGLLAAHADILTFAQKSTDPVPHCPYRYEWDSVAAIPIRSYDDWWTNRVSGDLRKDVRRAAKRGVIVRSVAFTDDLVRQIKKIYDETPIRQGRPFWHYQKPLDVVKAENSTYLERSEFLGAFCGDELIGFVKIVFAGQLACLMQIIAKDAHRDKRPMNALIAKTVEVSAAKSCIQLTYGKYRYYGVDSSLTAFKHRNGFEEILVPKYYVPLTKKGSIALAFGFHRELRAMLPVPIRRLVKRLRAVVYKQSSQTQKAVDILAER